MLQNQLLTVINVIDASLVNELMNTAYHNWANLDKWWVNSCDIHGVNNKLSQPYLKYYEQAVHDFVGSWEQACYMFANDETLSNSKWDNINIKIHPYLRHLELTAKVLLTSVKTDNYIGASWGADMLQKWYSSNMHNDLDYATLAAETPDHIQPAYDGMTLEFPLS